MHIDKIREILDDYELAVNLKLASIGQGRDSEFAFLKGALTAVDSIKKEVENEYRQK